MCTSECVLVRPVLECITALYIPAGKLLKFILIKYEEGFKVHINLPDALYTSICLMLPTPIQLTLKTSVDGFG